MDNTTALEQITNALSLEIKAGILPKTIKARLLNNGAPAEMAEKIARIAELKAA